MSNTTTNQAYAGSGLDVNGRMSSTSHTKAQNLLGHPDTKVEFTGQAILLTTENLASILDCLYKKKCNLGSHHFEDRRNLILRILAYIQLLVWLLISQFLY